MNNRMTVFIISKILGVEGVLLLIPAFVALLYKEESALHFVVVSGVLFLIFLLAEIGRASCRERVLAGV